MTFDGFEAAMPIEVPLFPMPFLPVEPIHGPTLEDALAEHHNANESDPGIIDLTLLRPLSPDEMLLLAGGSGSEISVWGQRPHGWDPTPPNDPYPDGPYWGGGGGGQGTGPDGIDLVGRECPVDQAAARSAMDILYNNSPTARAMIDLAAARGVDLHLIMANLTGQGQQNSFNPNSNTIFWDPFQYAEGTNTDGSTYTLAPIMLLAHEFIHAAYGDDPAYQTAASEPLVMSIANQIAMELNAATGSHYDTTRDSHVRTGLYTTGSVTSTTPSIARPGCN